MPNNKLKQVIRPGYLYSTKSRGEGRILSLKDSVESPVLREIEKAAIELNLAPVVESDKAYPKSWWVKSGRVIVDKKAPKSITSKQIAAKIIKYRGPK